MRFSITAQMDSQAGQHGHVDANLVDGMARISAPFCLASAKAGRLAGARSAMTSRALKTRTAGAAYLRGNPESPRSCWQPQWLPRTFALVG